MAEPTEKKEPWLNYLALTTVILAVCATLSTFKGGSYSTRSVISQAQASDQWAYYQAKSLKQYLYELQRERLQLDVATMDPARLEKSGPQFRESIAHHAQEVNRYVRERADIEKKARGLESARDEAQQHAYWFSLAVIFLQVAILMCSVSALMKKMILWAVGSVVGLVGVFLFLNGFLLFWNPDQAPAATASPGSATPTAAPPASPATSRAVANPTAAAPASPLSSPAVANPTAAPPASPLSSPAAGSATPPFDTGTAGPAPSPPLPVSPTESAKPSSLPPATALPASP